MVGQLSRDDIVNRLVFLKVRKNGQQKTCNLFCNVAAKLVEQRCCAFSTHITPVLQQIRFLLTVLKVGGKTRNIAIQLVLQQCCKTSFTFFVARFSVRLTPVVRNNKSSRQNAS